MAYLLISISMIKLTVSYSIPHTCSLLPFKMSTLTKIQRGSKSLTTGSNFFPTPQEDSFGAVLCLFVKATRGDERNVYFSTLRTEKTIIGQRRDIKYWQRGVFLMNGKLAPALKLDTRVTTFTAKGGIRLYTEQRREK